MSIYTTPLQFGYFFALLMWVIFNYRGFKENRLSDKLLGWIMFLLAMELQDYTFGFAGINVLWNELNGFPRGVSLLFGPIVYFYFLSQVNRSFRLTSRHLWHFLPYAFYFIYELSAFVQGPAVVERRYASTLNQVLSYIHMLARIASYAYYLSRCLVIYKRYRKWSLNQFSNMELINFNWFRDFIYAMIFWLVCREVMNIIDSIYDLDFYQDWWWNLALVVVTFYIGLAGYSQKQPSKIAFDPTTFSEEFTSTNSGNSENSALATKLQKLMESDRIFLQPELSLSELSQLLQTTSVQLSSTINQTHGINFNDYINTLRVDEFIQRCREDQNQRFTLLSIALDSGFNSKATFNRAFKKIKGISPKEYIESSLSE